MNVFTAKNQMEFFLRPPTVDDSQKIVDFYNFIGGETDYLSFGENEYPLSVTAQAEAIQKKAEDKLSLMLLAIHKDEIVGIVTIDAHAKRKFKHTAVLGIGIKQKFCKIGLGTYMIKSAIELTKNNGVTKKINLVTREDNLGGIAVYENLGFKTEGVFVNESYENGKYYNSLSMALFL